MASAEMISQVKEMQRTDQEAKMQWWAHCALNGEGIRDPSKHDDDFISGFIEQYNSGSRLDVPEELKRGKGSKGGAKGASKGKMSEAKMGKMQMMMEMFQMWYGGGDGSVSSAGSSSGGGKKRKAETQDVSHKSLFVHKLALLIGRPVVKADMTWEVEGADGKYIGTLTLPEMDKTFVGEPASSKKAAEHAAAAAALEGMKEEIQTVEEEHKAKKAKKNQESLAALKLRTDEKKAEKKAAKAAEQEA